MPITIKRVVPPEPMTTALVVTLESANHYYDVCFLPGTYFRALKKDLLLEYPSANMIRPLFTEVRAHFTKLMDVYPL